MIFLFCRHLRDFLRIAVMGNLHTEDRASRRNFVGGRRSVEELYQVLFFVSPVPPECFTERNENRA